MDNSSTDGFVAKARALLGEKGFLQSLDDLAPWLTDWRGRYTGKAIGLAAPASTQEVSALVKICADHGVPIVPQGGNSGMSGGATPDNSGRAVILSLRRLDTIHPVDTETRQVRCDAGVILQNLHEAAEAEGLRFPLTLGGKGSATVGGLISTNAGGTQVLRHGTMGAQVLGLEAVLADGSILNMLEPLKKDNRGFDLKQTLIGSEGTLGIVTGATLKLVPQIAERTVIWLGLPSVQAARAVLVAFETAMSEELEGFEIIPSHALTAVLDHLPDARSPVEGEHNWHALVEIVSDTEKHMAQLRERIEHVIADQLDAGLVADGVLASSEAQAEAFWLLRDSISAAEKALGPAMQHDVSVPVAKMADFVAETIPLVEKRFPGTRGMAFGHLGDGNVHYHVRAPADGVPGNWEEKDGKAISVFVHDLVTQWGGSISAEHGIGQMKREELARVGDPVANAMMRAVKLALDPQGILNPGKLVP
ncbi:FAD-binding oxidoreductase [Erythrobacter sp. W53]|uniref:FAD-binding oxidoreductase n=1 Tax=Erythrobacter sp. W53 TaxID=3425947 RepID=UPI003D76A1BE